MDDQYRVETPEVVAIVYRVAGAGSRCLAAALDSALLLLLQGALGVAVLGAATALTNDLGSIVLAAWAILAFLLLWGYYLFFELRWSGQTPGKRLFGLRVMREGGRPVDFSASAIRNLIRVVDFLPLGYGLGVLTVFADARARRLGDLAAGTLVVREGQTLSLEAITRGAAPVLVPPRAPDAPAAPLLPNLHLARADDYALAELFLRSREELAPERRAALAEGLAAALRARLGLATAGAAERFIEHFVREYRVFHAPPPA